MKFKPTVILVFFTTVSLAQNDINPVGFYYKTGGSTVDQWFQVLATDNGDFAVSDIYGQGFNTNFNDGLAVVNSSSQITVNSTPNSASYVLNRTTTTDPTFPLTADRLFTPNPLFEGDWNISELLLDPVTGDVLRQFDGSCEFIDVFTLSIEGQGLRFTDSLGTYFQGAMVASDQVIFRFLNNARVNIPTTGPYANVPGSLNNFFRDNVGSGHFTDINRFEVLLAIQNTTTNNGLQQFLLAITGTRVNPLIAGDVNGDGEKNALDLAEIEAAIGMVKNQDDGFNIASDLNADGRIDFRDLQLFNDETVPTQSVDATMTALWYDPIQDGQGWDLQILNQQTAHLSWYTFDQQGNQLWATGLGQITGNEINFPNLRFASQGTPFGEAFDSSEIVMSDWGSVHMYFENCNEAGFTYSSQAGFGFGGLKPQRLLNHSGLDCENQTINPAEINRFTGLWYDPIHDGEGWMIQVRNSTAFISWYTYDENAQPMWLIGSGEINDNVLTIDNLIVTSGATFGPDFDPDTVERTPWGTMTFTLSDCLQGTISYQAINPELGNGTLKPVRLASVTELACVD